MCDLSSKRLRQFPRSSQNKSIETWSTMSKQDDSVDTFIAQVLDDDSSNTVTKTNVENVDFNINFHSHSEVVKIESQSESLQNTTNCSLSSCSSESISDEVTSEITSKPTISKAPTSRSVRFNKVTVREYGVDVGDNPSCSSGPPITLSWKYDKGNQYEFPLEMFEQNRNGQRRELHQMRIPADIRYNTLRSWNISKNDILVAQKQCCEIRRQRLKTIQREKRKEDIKQFTRRVRNLVITCREQ